MTNEAVTITQQNPLWTKGGRKTSMARVRVIPGQGRLFINAKSVEDYFGGHARQKATVMAALKLVPSLNTYDLIVNAQGGGVTGQAGAIRMALARAIVAMDPNTRSALRKLGFLTRDPRMVERKKYGQPKARRRFQHSKR